MHRSGGAFGKGAAIRGLAQSPGLAAQTQRPDARGEQAQPRGRTQQRGARARGGRELLEGERAAGSQSVPDLASPAGRTVGMGRNRAVDPTGVFPHRVDWADGFGGTAITARGNHPPLGEGLFAFRTAHAVDYQGQTFSTRGAGASITPDDGPARTDFGLRAFGVLARG